MHFTDSTQFHIPESIKYADSDSSPFNSDESASDDESLQKPMTHLNTSIYECPLPSSNNNSPINFFDNLPFKQMIITPHTDISIERSRHLSRDQSNIHHPPIDRTTKTHYTLRRQPSVDYRLFKPPSKLYK